MSRPKQIPALFVVFALALTSGAAGADRTLTAAGTIVRLDAKVRTLVVAVADGPETTFLWTDETKIAGTLAPGARVTLRYAPGGDGKNVALQITVLRA